MTTSKLTRKPVDKFNNETELRLARYIANRNERTNDKWRVVSRHTTYTSYMVQFGDKCVPYDGDTHKRAIIENMAGKCVRLWYDVWNWRAA